MTMHLLSEREPIVRNTGLLTVQGGRVAIFIE